MAHHLPGHRGRSVTMLAALAVLVALLPAPVLAHAELDTAEPADGSTVEVAPTEIVMTFTQDLDPSQSSLVVVTGGSEVASGGMVDPADPRRMTLALPGARARRVRGPLDDPVRRGRRARPGHDGVHVHASPADTDAGPDAYRGAERDVRHPPRPRRHRQPRRPLHRRRPTPCRLRPRSTSSSRSSSRSSSSPASPTG